MSEPLRTRFGELPGSKTDEEFRDQAQKKRELETGKESEGRKLYIQDRDRREDKDHQKNVEAGVYSDNYLSPAYKAKQAELAKEKKDGK